MLFAALMKVRAGTEQERVARRLKWDVPEEISVVGEYWLHTSEPEVLLIFEADSFSAMMQVTSDWSDVYHVDIFPAICAEEGIQMAEQMQKESEKSGMGFSMR